MNEESQPLTSQPRGPQEQAKQATKRQISVSRPLPAASLMCPLLNCFAKPAAVAI